MSNQPTMMQRLVLSKAGANRDMSKASLEVQNVPVPRPRPGEVLIKVEAAPVNPSDYGAFIGVHGENDQPAPLGKEGSGVVVASGGGLMASMLAPVGTKVGFVLRDKDQGSYSEYVTAPVMQAVFPMPADLDVEQAASFFVNPYTVFGILDTVAELGKNGLVHTAAASQVGQMVVKLCAQRGIALVNVVRREEQAEALRALGATDDSIVVTARDGWQEDLKAKIAKERISLAFDAIAGEMSGTLLGLLPPAGEVFVYGGLSHKPVANVSPLDLIYNGKKLNGWLLTSWIKKGGGARTLARLNRAKRCVNPGLQAGGWAESRFVDTTLDAMWSDFLGMYEGGGFTDKKLRIRFPKAAPPPPAAPAA